MSKIYPLFLKKVFDNCSVVMYLFDNMNELNKLVEIGNVVTVGKRWKQHKSVKRWDASMLFLEAIRAEETAKGNFSLTVDEVMKESENAMYEKEIERWVGGPVYFHSGAK